MLKRPVGAAALTDALSRREWCCARPLLSSRSISLVCSHVGTHPADVAVRLHAQPRRIASYTVGTRERRSRDRTAGCSENKRTDCTTHRCGDEPRSCDDVGLVSSSLSSSPRTPTVSNCSPTARLDAARSPRLTYRQEENKRANYKREVRRWTDRRAGSTATHTAVGLVAGEGDMGRLGLAGCDFPHLLTCCVICVDPCVCSPLRSRSLAALSLRLQLRPLSQHCSQCTLNNRHSVNSKRRIERAESRDTLIVAHSRAGRGSQRALHRCSSSPLFTSPPSRHEHESPHRRHRGRVSLRPVAPLLLRLLAVAVQWAFPVPAAARWALVRLLWGRG